ncbi:transposase [Frankia sp. Cppng1_Ct_nod]|uniref:transposase n=1 Tax=Frankia sp. Cppng1_Ct_nod TaxID=2897162 RepID=UPI001041B79C
MDSFEPLTWADAPCRVWQPRFSLVPGNIFLIVDGYRAHTAKATKKFVESTDDRIKLFYLPPYSPELNPD